MSKRKKFKKWASLAKHYNMLSLIHAIGIVYGILFAIQYAKDCVNFLGGIVFCFTFGYGAIFILLLVFLMLYSEIGYCGNSILIFCVLVGGISTYVLAKHIWLFSVLESIIMIVPGISILLEVTSVFYSIIRMIIRNRKWRKMFGYK
jgi:hypothetical protein